MTQPYTHDEFLRLIFSSNAVAIWNNQTGPVFWYAASVPGPFYVNTEKLIGADAAATLLQDITDIMKKDATPADKSQMVYDAVMTEYHKNEVFQRVVATMVHGEGAFALDNYNCISGGERRDWFFSIPMAYETKKDHLFIFKNQDVFKRSAEGSEAPFGGEKTLHVADLIHHAASYFDNWLPVLERHNMNVVGTVCAISRGRHGLDRLDEIGLKNHKLKGIDPEFFTDILNDGLISQDVFDEIDLYFNDKQNWVQKYILGNADLFDIASLDEKSKTRLKNFLINDPWDVADKAAETFKTLKAALDI